MGAGIGFTHGEKSPFDATSPQKAAWFRPLAAIAFPLVVAGGCGGPLSALEPEGPSARGAAVLWWFMLAGSAVIFLAVSMMLALALLRPQALRAFGASRTILWAGLVVPSLILAALVGAALALGERLLATTREEMPLRIEVVARQWSWEFHYPDGSSSSGRLHLPAGEDVDFAVTSEDVIHSFWIPRLGGKIDAIPGHENVVRLRADKPGVFGGVCAEYCGTGHAVMPFTVEAHDKAGFDAALVALSGKALP
ncbi:Cytochrome c oxidase polypeptide II [Hyphomicrobiales bacterium]|nr:Cytochrome c oxidase polypeptide II [Hyphomicrobiales bacterium]CAH1693034.1 Cytochrome c oxidase polypeptide II [Hyphomicrobiales bacterium]